MKAWTRFREGGGIRLIKTFAKMGLLFDLLKVGLNVLIMDKNFRQQYTKLHNKVKPKLIKEFNNFLANDCKPIYNTELTTPKDESNKNVWFCWLQGIDKAPDIVKACLKSQKKWIKGRTFVTITADNYSEYISLPQFIEEKYAKGAIPNALFSDLIRLELLINYGGTWIDSTVMITGRNFPEEILDCQLFMPQYVSKSGAKCGISNWMITAEKGNYMLILLREMLLEYWRRYDCVIDYYIFHIFFGMIAGKYPNEFARMPILNSYFSTELIRHLGEYGQSDNLDRFLSKVSIHKLGHRPDKKVLESKDNIYHKLLELLNKDEIPIAHN